MAIKTSRVVFIEVWIVFMFLPFFLLFNNVGRARLGCVKFLSLYFCRVDVGIDVEVNE